VPWLSGRPRTARLEADGDPVNDREMEGPRCSHLDGPHEQTAGARTFDRSRSVCVGYITSDNPMVPDVERAGADSARITAGRGATRPPKRVKFEPGCPVVAL
jgi:hypothetical protein